jgi:hypothetical protein
VTGDGSVEKKLKEEFAYFHAQATYDYRSSYKRAKKKLEETANLSLHAWKSMKVKTIQNLRFDAESVYRDGISSCGV